MPVLNTNRNITADNWYSSIELVDELNRQNTTYVGTLRKNKRELPAAFLPHRDREPGSSIFGFAQKKTIVSYVPKKNKAVALISSMHNTNTIDANSGKPEIVEFYNATKSGVDSLDQKCANYTTSRRCQRWPLAIFFAMLDIAGVNTGVLVNTTRSQEKVIQRRQILTQLGLSLTKPHLMDRVSINSLPRELRKLVSNIVGIESTGSSDTEVSRSGRKNQRCSLCPRSADRKTTRVCSICKKGYCKDHLNEVCPECI